MALTLPELKVRLAAKFNEVEILEILDLHTDQIVEAFADLVEERQEQLEKLFEEDDEFSPEILA